LTCQRAGGWSGERKIGSRTWRPGGPAYTVQPLKTRRKIASSLSSSPSLISTPKTAAWLVADQVEPALEGGAVDALGGAGLLVAAEVEQAVVADGAGRVERHRHVHVLLVRVRAV
jgi:hypothetical protein